MGITVVDVKKKFGEFVALVGSEGADAAELNPDRRKVSESAQCEGGDSEGARIERSLHGAELREGD